MALDRVTCSFTTGICYMLVRLWQAQPSIGRNGTRRQEVLTSRWRRIPTPRLVPRRTRRTVKHGTSRSALTSFGMRLLSASSTSSMLRQTVNSQMFSPRRRQLPCCGCSKHLWTAQPRSLCWLACTSNLPLLFPTRPRLQSQEPFLSRYSLATGIHKKFGKIVTLNN